MLISDAFHKYITEDLLLYDGSAKTAKNYTVTINSFLHHVGDLPLSIITDSSIKEWIVGMQEAGKKSGTIHSYCGHMRQVLRFARMNGIETLDPSTIRTPKVRQKPPVTLTADEISRLVQASDNIRDRLLVSFLYSTGCRISEALSINRQDIREDTIVVIGKNQKYRTVFIDERTLILLEQYLLRREDDLAPLFITQQDTRMTVQRAEQIMHEIGTRSGITKHVTPHVMRHSFATSMMENGAHSRVVQVALGHDRLTTTERYLTVSDHYLKKSYNDYHHI